MLALIDSVFALAFHHDQRAQKELLPDYESGAVRAEIAGPEQEDPAPGGLRVRVSVTLEPLSEEREVTETSVSFVVDLVEERLLAADLALAELPLDRGGLARLIGELEAWCYTQIPIFEPSTPDSDDDAGADEQGESA